MTREEAIGILEEHKGYYVDFLPAGKKIGKAEEWGKVIEAYDTAIEALRGEVYKVVSQINVEVDEDELIKALEQKWKFEREEEK